MQAWDLTPYTCVFLLFASFLGEFSRLLGIIILLKGPLDLSDRWPYIIFKHSLI